MAAYIIAEVDVFDQELFEKYQQLVPPTVAAHGGRFLVRGGALERLEGDRSPVRVVIIEFEDSAKAAQWWNSPEYGEAKRLRQRSARTEMILVEGT
jgi:uncharacterized protein (DUF1330 family)